MHRSIAITLACSLVLVASCRKDDAPTTDPGSAGEGMLGLDVGSSPSKKPRGTTVSVGCIQDPADPDCAEVLGAKQTDGGEIEFTGDACRTNLCSARGTCELDSEGFVACTCDEGATGQNCEKRKR